LFASLGWVSFHILNIIGSVTLVTRLDMHHYPFMGIDYVSLVVSTATIAMLKADLQLRVNPKTLQ
jgi:hypothetical protein